MAVPLEELIVLHFDLKACHIGHSLSIGDPKVYYHSENATPTPKRPQEEDKRKMADFKHCLAHALKSVEHYRCISALT